MIPGAGGLRKTNVRYAATARMQQPKMIQVIIRKKKKKRKRKTRSCNVKRRPPVHSPKALETKRKKRHYLLLPASMAHVPTRKSRAKTLSLQLQVRNCRVKQLSIDPLDRLPGNNFPLLLPHPKRIIKSKNTFPALTSEKLPSQTTVDRST